MSSLQETVLGALPERDQDTLSPSEMACCQGTIPLDAIGEQARAVQEGLARGDTSGVPMLAAMASTEDLMEEGALFYMMLLYIEALDSSSIPGIQGMVDRIEENIERRKRDQIWAATVGDWGLVLVYMREVWGKRTTAVLAELAGVSRSTAGRWMRGATPSWQAKHSVWNAGQIVYKLREYLGFSPEEVRDFFESPQDGEVPLRVWHMSRTFNNPPRGVSRFLEERGISV